MNARIYSFLCLKLFLILKYPDTKSLQALANGCLLKKKKRKEFEQLRLCIKTNTSVYVYVSRLRNTAEPGQQMQCVLNMERWA